jgi:hypothetical protein
MRVIPVATGEESLRRLVSIDEASKDYRTRDDGLDKSMAKPPPASSKYERIEQGIFQIHVTDRRVNVRKYRASSTPAGRAKRKPRVIKCA